MAEIVLARDWVSGAVVRVDRHEIGFAESIDVSGAPLDAGLFTGPGLVDLQVNGFAGVDYNSPGTPLDCIERSLKAIARTGVTCMLPTVITGSRERMRDSLRNLARARDAVEHRRMIAGFHVEGPHLSPEDGPRGAHPLRHIRPPDLRELDDWQEVTGGAIRIVTVSPHWPASEAYIQRAARSGIVVSIGHTHASDEQIARAVDAGATLSTHLGNAAHPVLPKTRNYIWTQMAEDRLMAGFIADGVHIPAAFLKSALRAKGLSRSILVTDASSPAGAMPGPYRLGEVDVELTPDNRVVMAGTDRLAGSSLKLNDGVLHAARAGSLAMADALRMATLNPARAISRNRDWGRMLFRWSVDKLNVLATTL